MPNPSLSSVVDAIQARGFTGSPLQIMTEKRDLLRAAMDNVRATAARENRSVHASEARALAHAQEVFDTTQERVEELEAEEKREAQVAAIRAEHSDKGVVWNGGPVAYTNSTTYHRGNESPSYFLDLYRSRFGDYDAQDRLRRNFREVSEQRAMGNTGGTGGSGGEMAPPLWLVEDWIRVARPSRVTVDLFHREDLPNGVSSVNIPKAASGTTTAIQSTQNTALSQTDMVTSALSSSITTIGGKALISQQLLDQTAGRFDQILLSDLVADYAKQIGQQTLTGTGTSGQLKGYLTPSSTNVVTWTQASPTVGGLFGQLSKLISQIQTSRYAQPDALVLHPRRWMWMASATDSTGRPLVVPNTNGYNTMATPGASVSAGHVGSVLGIETYIDPSIPTNLGAGSNQDVILAFPRDDIWFWESTLRTDVLTETYGDSLGVLFRAYSYSALIPDRYLSSLGQIQGTGLVAPTFNS